MTKQRGRQGRRDRRSLEWWRELDGLFDETVRVYLRLSAVAVKMHHKGQLSGPRRTVLLGLARSGPQTVAQMARQREQSRQRFQPLVNGLLAEGLVRAIPNPAHKQSPLIALTPKGRATVERIRQIERAWRPRLHIDASKARLKNTVDVMRLIRAALERVLHA